jgi:phage-related protein (TIGR01555 family)
MRTRFNNAAFRDGLGQTGGPMGGGDRGAYQTVSLSSGNPYFFSDFVTRWRLYVGLYQTSWEARKIIRIVPEDALRKEWIAENIPEEQAKRISLKLKQLKFINVLKRSLMLERLLGGCLTFMGLDSKEDKPEIPYKYSEGSKLRFMNPIPLSRISRMTWENNPLSMYYMRPHKYLINSQEVHASRLLVWDGEPLFDPYDYSLNNFRSNLAGFGPSKLAPIWDDIVKAVGTRQAAYQLIQTNNAIVMAVNNLQDLAGTTSGKLALEKVKDIANQLSLYRAAVIDGESVQVKTKPASFGSVPELLMTFIQILSAASDIPATRFIGQAPGGLNATGESDLENYYNVIDSYQVQRIEPELRKVYDVIGYGEFGNSWDKSREELGFKFPPLWNASELEEAQTRSLIIDNSLKLFEQGLISEEKVIEEINNKEVLSIELDETDIQITDDSGLGFEEGIDPRIEIQKLLDREPGAPEPVSRLSPTKSSGTKSTPPSVPNVSVPKQEGNQQPKVAKTTVPLQNKIYGEDLTKLFLEAGGGNSFSLFQFEKGMDAEQEHSETVGNDLILIAKIVLDHLKEYPDYYDKLEKVENQIKLDPLPKPTEKQIKSGNYKKHHIKVQGLDISIENPKGSQRTGLDESNSNEKTKVVWEVTMPSHYGYIRKTEGSDGDHVDVYVGPEEKSELVFIVDQQNPDSKEFDEHKCIMGCLSMMQAKELYIASFSDGKGKDRIKAITPVYMDDFKKWLETGDTTKSYSNKCGESGRTKR